MTHITRSKWILRCAGMTVCTLLAGCMGGGSGGATVEEGPRVIVDQPDPVVPEEPGEDIVDIITDIVTTTVSVTTVTSTTGTP